MSLRNACRFLANKFGADRKSGLSGRLRKQFGQTRGAHAAQRVRTAAAISCYAIAGWVSYLPCASLFFSFSFSFCSKYNHRQKSLIQNQQSTTFILIHQRCQTNNPLVYLFGLKLLPVLILSDTTVLFSSRFLLLFPALCLFFIFSL